MPLHHVQIAAPAGSEDLLRGFYGALGFTEVAKPALLAVRGGCWFTLASGTSGTSGAAELHVDTGAAELHVGIEDPFTPARKAHPAFDVGADLDAVAARAVAAGATVTWADPAEWAGSHLVGLRRFHTHDPVGNRLEMVGR